MQTTVPIVAGMSRGRRVLAFFVGAAFILGVLGLGIGLVAKAGRAVGVLPESGPIAETISLDNPVWDPAQTVLSLRVHMRLHAGEARYGQSGFRARVTGQVHGRECVLALYETSAAPKAPRGWALAGDGVVGLLRSTRDEALLAQADRSGPVSIVVDELKNGSIVKERAASLPASVDWKLFDLFNKPEADRKAP